MNIGFIRFIFSCMSWMALIASHALLASLGSSKLILYANGQGVKQDYHKAANLYQKACDGGLQPGCDEYRELNEKGIN